MKRTLGFLLGIALALPAVAATAIGVPSLGYLYDASERTLTPLLGIPGTAVRGGAIALPETVERFHLAPGQGFGLAILQDGAAALLDVRTGAAAVSAIDQAMTAPDSVRFSASGETALLYSKADGRLQVITGLAGTPAVAHETVASNAALLGVSDDGAWVAFANASGLWMVDGSGTLSQVLGLEAVGALAFRPGSSELAVAAGGALYRIAAPGSEPALVVDGLEGISAVAAAADGSYLFARTGQTVTAVRTDDGTTAVVGCDCEVTAFEPLSGRNVFRLSAAGNGPTYLFDGSGTTPRVVFIPGQAPAEAELSEGGSL